MPSLILVMAGGALGAGARWGVGVWTLGTWGSGGWPLGTLLVNLAGGLLMGVLAGAAPTESARLLLGVGVLGGFTTFSAFSLEVVTLMEGDAAGLALGYALASVVGAAVACWLGLLLARSVA